MRKITSTISLMASATASLVAGRARATDAESAPLGSVAGIDGRSEHAEPAIYRPIDRAECATRAYPVPRTALVI